MNAHWSGDVRVQPRTARAATPRIRRCGTRKALARIAVVLRGGHAAEVNATLAKLGLPGVAADLPVTTPKLRIVWNPQGFGAPDVPGNSAQAYYPGDAYVDVVGDDLYDMPGHGATWAAAETLYKAHSVEAVRVPRVRALGLRRSAVRPRHGEMGEAAPPGRVRLRTSRAGPGSVCGSCDEACVARGVSRADHAARGAP